MNLLTANRSTFGALNVRVKLSICFGMSILAVLADGLALLVSLALTGAAVFSLSRPNRSQIKLVVFVSVLIVWGMMFSQAIFYNLFPRHTLVTLVEPGILFDDGLKIFYEGIRHGAIQSCRVLTIGFVGYAMCFSTEPDSFLKGLVAWKFPFSLAFMTVSAIQFVPVAAEEIAELRAAMRLKGYRIFRLGLRQTVRTEIGGLRAVLAGTIRHSEEKALSILTRGFDLEGPRTSFEEDRLKPGDIAVIAGLVVPVLGLAGIKLLFWLYQSEILYFSELRGIYAFTREWL